MKSTFALCIVFAASTALAEDLLNFLDESETADYRRLEARELQEARESDYCYERSTDIDDRCYFKSDLSKRMQCHLLKRLSINA